MATFYTKDIDSFLSDRIRQLYTRLVAKIKQVCLSDILRHADGYFLVFKNVALIDDFIQNGINRVMLPTEERLFHRLLVDLAVFICEKVYGGTKSSAKGIDLEFEKDGIKYIVTIKSGPHWGNSGQIKDMKANFKKAKRILGTNVKEKTVVAVNGCCYGRNRIQNKGDYLKFCGQKFWEFISGDIDLYTKIIEPLGHKAKQRNEEFVERYAQIINSFTIEFARDFCDEGKINWERLVRFNSSIIPPSKSKKENITTGTDDHSRKS